MSITINKYLKAENYLALAIGNSRLHWAWFEQDILVENWDTKHLSIEVTVDQLPSNCLTSNLTKILTKQGYTDLPVYLASVVPQQTKIWQKYSNLNLITLKDIDLKNIYLTLGIDRALAAWGAGETYSYPCLVIDGGTALTLTGIDKKKQLIGGAILPGLRSQLTSLKQKTAALPEIELPQILPPRWALDTDQAIASGIVHTAIAGIHSYIVDWQQQFPNSTVVFTGGDANLLAQYLHLQFPEIAQKTTIDHNLVFWGIKLVYMQRRNNQSSAAVYK